MVTDIPCHGAMTMKNINTPLLLAGIVLALAPAACTPTVAQRGNLVENHNLEQVVPMVHTRSDVLRILGSPTTVAPFDDKIWYYIGRETLKRGILDPEITKERVVKVTFNEEDIVLAVEEEASDHRLDIPIARTKTPTHGTDLTFMQQLLGNLGRFNPGTQEKPGR
ncbi:MAG: outer membrane protein assembly factor BamE [Alphaproteobacteria bacterium]|nr:outer membrane protein assembly factor BamE [Alphaproteobacteria bacterium]